ncbi:MAG: C39 family peptidase [bacterium]
MKLVRVSQNLVLLIALVVLAMPFSVSAGQLKVPFTPQAPDNNWVEPWQDLCEEASILMVDRYYQNKPLNKTQARTALIEILNAKNTAYGKSLDESTQEIVLMINNFFAFEARAVDNPTLSDLKSELDAGHPVIVPVNGKDLHNPNFINSGVRYHVLVLTGYDDERQQFMVNEPGTRLGENYRYAYLTILEAMHDLTFGDLRTGPKRAVFTSPNIIKSAELDGDKDGLSKIDEIRYGTSLILADTDKDGFKDGLEVESGYLPLVAESKIKNNTLIKTESSTAVYLLTQKIKRLIPNEATFKRHGYKWANVTVVSEKFLGSLGNGKLLK